MHDSVSGLVTLISCSVYSLQSVKALGLISKGVILNAIYIQSTFASLCFIDQITCTMFWIIVNYFFDLECLSLWLI